MNKPHVKIIILIILIILVYVCFAIRHYIYIETTQTSLVSNMGELRQVVWKYKLENNSIPTTLDELNIAGDSILKDPFTGEELIYIPECYSETNLVPLIYQKDYYRTQLWPLGKYKKYAIMSNLGVIRPIYQDDEESIE